MVYVIINNNKVVCTCKDKDIAEKLVLHFTKYGCKGVNNEGRYRIQEGRDIDKTDYDAMELWEKEKNTRKCCRCTKSIPKPFGYDYRCWFRKDGEYQWQEHCKNCNRETREPDPYDW